MHEVTFESLFTCYLLDAHYKKKLLFSTCSFRYCCHDIRHADLFKSLRMLLHLNKKLTWWTQLRRLCKSQHLVPEDSSNLQVTAVCVSLWKLFKVADSLCVMMYVKGFILFVKMPASFLCTWMRERNCKWHLNINHIDWRRLLGYKREKHTLPPVPSWWFFSQVLVVKGSHLKMIQWDCIVCFVVILRFDPNIVMWSEPRWKQK